jgi:hypothetical protein
MQPLNCSSSQSLPHILHDVTRGEAQQTQRSSDARRRPGIHQHHADSDILPPSVTQLARSLAACVMVSAQLGLALQLSWIVGQNQSAARHLVTVPS